MKYILFPLLLLVFSCGEEEQLEESQTEGLELNADSTEMIEPFDEESFQMLTSDDFRINNATYAQVVSCRIGLYQQQCVMLLYVEEQGPESPSNIWGEYFYVKHQKSLDLEGWESEATSAMQLYESHNEKKTGYMEFTVGDKGDDNFWAVNDTDTEHQELNSELLFNFDPSEIISIEHRQYEYEHQVMDMSVENEEDAVSDVTDILNVSKIGFDYLAFDLHVTRANFHLGSVDGIAKWTAEDFYEWSGEEGCKLVFDVAEDQIRVMDDGCDYYGGHNVDFNGTFERK